MLSLWFALPVTAILVALGIHVAVSKGLRAGYRKQQSDRSAENKEPLAPGRSLLGEIDREAIELKAHRICLFIQPILLAVIILIYYRYHLKLDLQYLVTSIVACGLVFLYCFWNMLRGRRAIKRYRLDYEAEVEVGSALDQLVTLGYHIFHGIREDNFDIDHVVVGPKGVFAIETKGHPRPSKNAGTADATVTYNGHALFFPRYTDEDTVARAVRQAENLSEWLGSGSGEALSARAVVVIPGWFVKRTTSDGAPVVNPDQFASLFEHIASRPLTEVQISRIVDLIQNTSHSAAPPAEDTQ